jgi:hypothetical protein
MFDVDYCRKLVHGWPITVEVYDSGQVGFCARPTINGRRFNKNFAASKYGGPQAAANAAIAFCQETREKHPRSRSSVVCQAIPTRSLSQYELLHHAAVSHGLDPIEILRNGIKASLSTEGMTVSQVIQKFLLSQGTRDLKQGYLRDLAGFYSAFENDFGRVVMAALVPEDVELWLRKRAHEKAAQSPMTWNEWRRKLSQLWQFALLPENRWVARNVVEEIPEK